MGLRTASVRHPDVAVMAPALTEAGQSQNFTLPPSSPVNDVSQNGGYASRDDGCPCKGDGLSTKRSAVSYIGGLVDPDSKLNAVFSKLESDNSRVPRAASDGGPWPSRLNIMTSARPTSMGDREDAMGLQKVGTDVAASLAGDGNVPTEMERLLSDLSADVVSASDVSHNVDEIMQVIKNMEGSSGDRVIGDSETEPMFPISFDRDLFGEVDVMSMCEDDHLSLSAPVSREIRAKETVEELQKRQLKLERRSEFLLRRLRKLQARSMGQHVSSEIAGLFEHVNKTVRGNAELLKESTDFATSNKGISVDTRDLEVALDDHTMKRLVRKIEMATILQSNMISRHRHVSKYFGSGSTDPAVTVSNRISSSTLQPLSVKSREELERVSGLLSSEMAVLEQQLDSDATASSSGGESCDEAQTYNNPHQQYLAINKRAAWKYANERAAIASRWTWLQAQISDLEYRIRQHNDMHRQQRISKGSLTFGDLTSPAHGAVNGYRGQLPGATFKSVSSSSSLEDTNNGAVTLNSPTTSGSARTRPLHKDTFRKRKLLQTTGLHTVSKRASRSSTVRCGCVPSVVPCALCTGRTDPTHPRDLPEQITVSDRVALLDPAFHPVLSFADDVSQSIHLEAIMKLPEWQQKSLRCNVKTLKGVSKTERSDKLITTLDNRSKKSEHRRKYNRLLKSNTANALGIKKKIVRGRKSFSRSSSLSRVSKKRHIPRVMVTQLQSAGTESIDEEMESLGVPSVTGKGNSLTSSPLSHVQVVPYRRNRVNSYDIDNIVIPYSVAASTRVEKLQYKEILTPKWRIIDNEFPAKYDVKNNGIVRRVSEDSDIEDVNDDIIAIRHDKCEHEEKKKFLSYIKFPLTGGRSRANRRTDSRAESSGANTPDPMSPHMGESSELMGSPITSPPATPLSVMTDESSQSVQRKRTVSQSRWTKDREREENRCTTPDHVEVAPYEHRLFPLCDDTYDRMLKSMPEGHPLPAFLNKQSSKDSDVSGSPLIDSRAGSPVSDSTESAIAEEDPNDPEWLDVERVRDRTKR